LHSILHIISSLGLDQQGFRLFDAISQPDNNVSADLEKSLAIFDAILCNVFGRYWYGITGLAAKLWGRTV